MQNLIRRSTTWYARLFIPKDRWADVGKAMGAKSGVKREVLRTLQTPDRREAKKRLGTSLEKRSVQPNLSLPIAYSDANGAWPGHRRNDN